MILATLKCPCPLAPRHPLPADLHVSPLLLLKPGGSSLSAHPPMRLFPGLRVGLLPFALGKWFPGTPRSSGVEGKKETDDVGGQRTGGPAMSSVPSGISSCTRDTPHPLGVLFKEWFGNSCSDGLPIPCHFDDSNCPLCPQIKGSPQSLCKKHGPTNVFISDFWSPEW